MKKIRPIILFSICLIFNSCSKQKTPGSTPPEISEIIQNANSFDDIFKKTGTVTLKPDTAHLIGGVSCMIRLSNGNIVVADNLGNQLLLFDNKGSFIKQIGRMGKGPGEYLQMSDILHDKNDNILLFSNNLQRVIEYKSDGSYINSITLGFGRKIALAKNNLYLYNVNPYPEGASLNLVTKYDLNGKYFCNTCV